MKKQDINNEISRKTKVNVTKTEIIVEAFMSTIKEKLSEKKIIQLRGFGNFYLKKKARKKARIIHKNVEIIIPEHYAPAFRPSKKFRNMVKRNLK